MRSCAVPVKLVGSSTSAAGDSSALGSQREAELKELRERCLAIVRFIGELALPEPFFGQMEQAIEAAFQRGDLRGLKMVEADLREWVTDLPSGDQERLDQVPRGNSAHWSGLPLAHL